MHNYKKPYDYFIRVLILLALESAWASFYCVLFGVGTKLTCIVLA